LGGGNHGTSLAFPSRRAIEINLEQLIFSNAPHNEVFPGPGPSWLGQDLAHHQSQDRQGTRSEAPPKLLAIADEVIVVLFAAVHMSLPGTSRQFTAMQQLRR
jgi:hypothetical protein